MDKRKHPLSDKQSKQACEIQSTGKKSKSEVDDLAQQFADQIVASEEPFPEEITDKADPDRKALEEKGIIACSQPDQKEKSFSEVISSSQFYPSIPREPFTNILDHPYRINDALIVEDFEGKFGLSTFALMLCEDLDTGAIFTTLCGGMVVVKKIRKALEGKMLPLIGTISKVGRYYDIQ